MKTREFDPVLSAALRRELEALPEQAAPVRPIDRLRRPQVWVTAVTALVLVLATVGVLRLTAQHAPEPAKGARILDPLTRLTDPDDPQYQRQGVWPLLHLSGTGPGTYALEVPEGTTSVRPLIGCAPAAEYRITIGRAVSSGCDRSSAPSTGDIPVSTGVQPIAVQVPEGVRWRLVVIETPEEGTTYSTLRVTGAPAAVPPVVRYPAPEREEDVPVGIAGGTGTVTGRLVAPVDELAVVTSCRGTGGLVIAFSNGLRFGTDEAPFTCGAGGRSTGAAGNDTTDGYRGDGRLTYTVRTIGDVRWTATFSSRMEERLPYPSVEGAVLGRVRGSSSESQGGLARAADRVRAVVTCEGGGTLSIGLLRADGSGDAARSTVPCGASTRRTEQELAVPSGSAGLRYDVRPSGDALWTATFVAG